MKIQKCFHWQLSTSVTGGSSLLRSPNEDDVILTQNLTKALNHLIEHGYSIVNFIETRMPDGVLTSCAVLCEKYDSKLPIKNQLADFIEYMRKNNFDMQTSNDFIIDKYFKDRSGG